MKRRHSDTEDSLELLLDAVSNAFGGILFLSILLALLLRMSQQNVQEQVTPASAQVELVELESQLSAALAHMESLERTVSLQDQSRERLLDPLSEQEYAALVSDKARARSIQSMIEGSRRDAVNVQISINETLRKDRELTDSLEAPRVANTIQGDVNRKERAKRAQTITPPRTRSTLKRECGVVLRYDRVYLEYQLDSSGFEQTLNLDDFVLLKRNDGLQHITANPISGLPVAKDDEFQRRLQSKLAAYRPREWYIAVIAWEDSFDHFQEVKRVLIDLGYEFRIIPAGLDDVFTEGHVPDPQVQ